LQLDVGSVMGIGVADLHDNFAIIAVPRHPDSEKLIAFWNLRAPDGIVMARDVPSRKISHLLSHVIVWEPSADRSNMKVRLAGAALQRRFSGDLKGRMMSDLFPPADFRSHLREALSVIESGAPLVLDSHVFCGNIEQLHLETVLLPIVSPDRAQCWLLAGCFYFL
jgi:hypothetical protein